MASIKAKFRPSATASKKGAIYYQIIHNRVVRQIKTSHRIFESEWDDKATAVSIPILSDTERKKHLQSIANRMEWDRKRLKAIIAMLDKKNECYTADDIVAKFNDQTNGQSLFIFMQGVISRLKQLNRIRTKGNPRRHVEQFHEVPRRARHLIVRA